jgi:ribose 5-phosphate isomerase RpiB
MAAFPDLGTAGLYGVVLFLLTLGVLVVFVETVSTRRLLAVLVGSAVTAAVLLGIGEAGIALLVLGFGAALVANQVFEWLTAGR